MRGWGIPSPLIAEGAFEADLAGRFAAFETAGYQIIEADGQAIGRIDFEQLDSRHGSVEIALYIGESGSLGKGYAADALRTLARYLFDQRGVRRIELTVIASNERARNLYEATGFVVEGVLRDNIMFDGAFHDEILMALHRDSGGAQR